MLHRAVPLGTATVQIRFTGQAEGDLQVDQPAELLASRRAAVHPGPWTWLRQVHGARVVQVDAPGAGAGEEADAAATDQVGATLAAHTADCVPVVLMGPTSAGAALAVVHAGWRGLVAGVLPAAVGALAGAGAEPEEVQAVVGPHIGPECYAFGAADLQAVSTAVGAPVASTTSGGDPSLDLAAAVRASLAQAGVHPVELTGPCTACDTGYLSHRARQDQGRQAAVAWIEAT